MRFDFWQSKQNIPFGGLNFSYLIDFGSFLGSASSGSVDISAFSSLCGCPKNAESLINICFDINLHSRT